MTEQQIEWYWKCPECGEDLNPATTEECECGFILTYEMHQKSLKQLID